MSTWQSIRSARTCILLASVSLFLSAGLSATASGPAPQSPATTPEELQIYGAFRSWITRQPADVQKADDDVVFQRYGATLRSQGKSVRDIEATIASLKAIGDRAEIERWNRILTAGSPKFNTSPNAFLIAVTQGLKPGRSLDVGMGSEAVSEAPGLSLHRALHGRRLDGAIGSVGRSPLRLRLTAHQRH